MKFFADRWHRLSYPDLYTTGDLLFFTVFAIAEIALIIGGAVFIVWLLPSI